MLHRLNRLFPLWAILASVLASWHPEPLTATWAMEGEPPVWLEGFFGVAAATENGQLLWRIGMPQMISPLLMLIMLCMGLTLTPADFARVVREPGKIMLGIALQFGSMPLLAWLVSRLLGLAPEQMVGMVLVGAAAGGTASNVIAWMAGGRVALSVTMTLVSTLAAIVMTPLLTELYTGRELEVPVLPMMATIARIVVAPVVLGVLVNRWLHRYLARWEQGLAFVSMLCIVTVIAVIFALNRELLFSVGPVLALAVVLHNLAGLASGYWGARLLGCDEASARTIAIEVGMQNSGLAAVLATQHFSAVAALPAALFSTWHNISGSLLAGYWGRTRQTGDRSLDAL